jgi:hypothetical protein
MDDQIAPIAVRPSTLDGIPEQMGDPDRVEERITELTPDKPVAVDETSDATHHTSRGTPGRQRSIRRYDARDTSMNAADLGSAAPQHMEAEMWMDAYVQETLLRQRLTDVDRHAERARMLHGDRSDPAPPSLSERVARILRRPRWSASRLVPQLRNR